MKILNFFVFAISLIIINNVSACPNPLCILDWECIIDSDCNTSYQYCDSILHVCKAKEGFCDTNEDCKTGICNLTTRKCEISGMPINEINKNVQIDIFYLIILIFYEDTFRPSFLNFALLQIQKIIKNQEISKKPADIQQCLNQKDARTCIKNLALNYAKQDYWKAIEICNYFKGEHAISIEGYDPNDHGYCINGVAAEVAKYDEFLAEKICDNDTDPSYAIHCITQISPIIAEKNLNKGLELCKKKGAREVCETLIAKMFAENLTKSKEICAGNIICLVNLAGDPNTDKEGALKICKELFLHECFVRISYKFYNDERIYEICNTGEPNSEKECLKNAAVASKNLTKVKELCNALEWGKDECLCYGIIALSTTSPDIVVDACNEIQSDFKITCLLESGINVGKINKEKGKEICNYLKNISEGHGNWCLSLI